MLPSQTRRCRVVDPECKEEWAVHGPIFHFARPANLLTALLTLRVHKQINATYFHKKTRGLPLAWALF
jgi:hypothetical protein